jgi:formamidopyrimidine-DNA glycosylase
VVPERAEGPSGRARLQSAAVPELPDLDILADAFQAALAGREVLRVEAQQSLVVRGTPADMEALGGQRLLSVSQRGKFLTFEFDRDRVVINAMLTGRLGLATPGARAFPQTAFTFAFGPRSPATRTGTGPAAAWTADAEWLPGDDDPIELRYRDSTRMGKVYLMPAGSSRPLPGWGEQGPDADDPALDLDTWRTRLRRYTGELKNLLRNQEFVAGIGNAYSDEILWASRLAPFRRRSSLAPDEVDGLYAATREVLPWAIDELRRRVPPRFEVEQRGFLRVHAKGGEACPRCGTRLTELSPGGFVVTFCRSCQR